MQNVEEKVDKLDAVLQEFVRNVGIEFNKAYNLHILNEIEFKAFKDEMKAFKDEMQAFKDEMQAFKDEMQAFKDEMKAFKEEAEKDRKALHDEMQAFKDEMRDETKKKNREWSNLAKKMGTIVEDLIAPALRPVLSSYFNCQVIMEGQRMFRRKDGEDFEIDAIAACGDKVFIIEAKSTPRFTDIKEITDKRDRFFEFFPEHAGKELYVIYGSITFPENIIRQASQNRIYVLGWREWEYMDILNFNEIT